LMLTDDGPKVVEFNSRFGDPETQVVLPLFDGDVLELLFAAATGTVGRIALSGENVTRDHAACVILASGGYPDAYQTGLEIRGLEKVRTLPNVITFHAGTLQTDDRIVTAGGRVLGVTALGTSLKGAIDSAYRAVKNISFDGMQYRHDIGRKALG